jgi:hypothetical protein
MYETAMNGLHKLFKQAQGAENWTKLIKRPFDILIMTIGGNLLVIPMKIAEDHKGALVRTADNLHAGKKNDPELEQAHAEMDAAPKQSWGSLLQSRVVTMLGAVGIDYAFGADDAWTSHISKNKVFKQWSTLNNINTSMFRGIGRFADEVLGFDKGAAGRIRFAETHSPYNIISNSTLKNMQANDPLRAVHNLQSEGKIAAAGKSYGFIFLLSGVLAGTFYLTSRVFAFNRDLKEHHRDDAKPHGAHQGANAHHESAPASVEQLERSNETPKTKVSHAHVTDRLAQAPHEAVGING